MGMFDSLYAKDRSEWQTKAYGCVLAGYRAGDQIGKWNFAYQVKVLGDTGDAYATVRNGRLKSVPDERDETLPLLDYCGGWL